MTPPLHYSTFKMAGGSSHPHHKVDTVPRSGLVWGIDRGHKTTRRVPAVKASRRKGKLSQRSAVVKSVVREVAGFAPYERRAMELIRNSKVSTLKRSLRWSREAGQFQIEQQSEEEEEEM